MTLPLSIAEAFPEVDITEADKRTCLKWAKKAVAFEDGALDPEIKKFLQQNYFSILKLKSLGLNTNMSLKIKP